MEMYSVQTKKFIYVRTHYMRVTPIQESGNSKPSTGFSDPDILRQIKEFMEGAMEKQSEKLLENITNLQDHIKCMNDQLNDLKKTIRDRDLKMDDCLAKMNNLVTENSKLQKDNNQLRARMNDLEQYSRSNSVEICGAPEVRDENVVTTVCAVALHCSISETMIDACHQSRKNPQHPDQPRPIIVKFVDFKKKNY